MLLKVHEYTYIPYIHVRVAKKKKKMLECVSDAYLKGEFRQMYT